MNAYVEVATAETVAQTVAAVVTTILRNILEVIIPVVATSTKRVLSIAGSSISAVAPDHNFKGGTALAAA